MSNLDRYPLPLMLRLEEYVVVAGLPAESGEAVAAIKYPCSLTLAYDMGSSIMMDNDVCLERRVAYELSGVDIQEVVGRANNGLNTLCLFKTCRTVF
jgi:hypothetical protein